MVDACANYFNGALKFDYKWFLTREILVINSAAWVTMKNVVWNIMAQKYPTYDPNTFWVSTVNGASEGCIYTPCYGIEVGMPNCPP